MLKNSSPVPLCNESPNSITKFAFFSFGNREAPFPWFVRIFNTKALQNDIRYPQLILQFNANVSGLDQTFGEEYLRKSSHEHANLLCH